MMKSIILFIVITPFFPFLSNSKSFDFEKLNGVSFGMTKQKVISVLKTKNASYEEKNNNVGGKYIKMQINRKIYDENVEHAIVSFNKGKVFAYMLYLSGSNYENFRDNIDKESNCRYNDEENGTIAFIFDNCTVSVNTEKGTVFIIKKSFKCDEQD